jgi:hypothetical protein
MLCEGLSRPARCLTPVAYRQLQPYELVALIKSPAQGLLCCFTWISRCLQGEGQECLQEQKQDSDGWIHQIFNFTCAVMVKC